MQSPDSVADSGGEATLVRFQALSTHVNPAFWHDLSTLKLNHLHLSEEPIPLQAAYSTGRLVKDRVTGKDVSIACNVTLDHLGEGGDGEDRAVSSSHRYVGHIINFNTIESFRSFDKTAHFARCSQALLNSFVDAKAVTSTEDESDIDALLNPFFILTYSDLKKYKFYYWAAFPALVAKPAWQLTPDQGGHAQWKNAKDELGDQAFIFLTLSVALKADKRSFFLAKLQSDSMQTGSLFSFPSFFNDVPMEKRYLVFIDPSSSPSTPGWPLRNALAFLSVRFEVRAIQVVAWRDEPNAFSSRSIVASLSLGPAATSAEGCVTRENTSLPIASLVNSTTAPSAVGWERNSAGKLAPKIADLGGSMDPRRLADQAVDLNLKLMRWRIMPDINLERIQGTKCLLLGAGTLGCYVSRVLLGWGVRKITLLDSSRVSFSNPVRQPLFDFEDCLEGGAPKAARAAEKLRKIYPGVEAEGVHMAVPMPGHPIDTGAETKVKGDLERLQTLIDDHDVIYLLMDSRESRWLPTLLGAAKGKLVINAALGFDTYLVMRHGAGPHSKIEQPSSAIPPGVPTPHRLGCYFCNDVVAPADSLTDRTLDQMCTVTRPGLAAIAGASAVELMVSVIQHKDGVQAPAVSTPPRSSTSDVQTISTSLNASVPLGVLPHQIRGGLSTFSTHLVVGSAYDRCTACSPTVIDEWNKGGFDMLHKACGEQGWLEKLTGLDKVQEDARKAAEEMEAFDLDDDEGDGWGEAGEDGEGELI